MQIQTKLSEPQAGNGSTSSFRFLVVASVCKPLPSLLSPELRGSFWENVDDFWCCFTRATVMCWHAFTLPIQLQVLQEFPFPNKSWQHISCNPLSPSKPQTNSLYLCISVSSRSFFFLSKSSWQLQFEDFARSKSSPYRLFQKASCRSWQAHQRGRLNFTCSHPQATPSVLNQPWLVAWFLTCTLYALFDEVPVM